MVDERAPDTEHALGDPTRHELFRYIADAGRPVDVAELTEHLGVHHNRARDPGHGPPPR